MAKTKKNTRKKQAAKKANTINHIPVYTITTGLLALFLGIFMYMDPETGGIINHAVRSFFCGLFGKTGFLVPVISLGMMIYMSKYRSTKKFWTKLTLILLAVSNISALVGLYTEIAIENAYWIGAQECIGGGIIGTAIAFLLMSMFARPASYIILIITLIILLSFISGLPLFLIMGRQAKKAAENAKTKYDDLKDKYSERKEEKERELRNFADKSIKFETPAEAELPEPRKRKSDFSDGIDEVFGEMTDSFTKDDVEVKKTTGKINNKKEKASENKSILSVSKITEEEKQNYHQEFDSAMTAVEKKEYVYPTAELLNPIKKTPNDLREELRKTAEKLIVVLNNFGVKAKLLQVTQGPTVTRFEIQPDTGIKLSKIVGLADDIALNLAVSTVLVAPVRGKAAVGIEIPNNKVSTVSIREMIESDKFRNAKSKLTVALGKDIGGNVVIGDIAKMPHVLIAGATGSGKSVCINTIITSLLYKATPDEVKLIMVDPKVVELGVYNGIPHLLVPVVTEAKKAAGALNWAVTEMMRRYDLFKDTGVRKLESYNELMESRGEEKIPQLVIIIDELADLMMVAAKEVEDYICRLAQLARAAGIHLIIATQRPSVDVITGLIKANIPSRIAFAVSSQVDSRTILDKGGAEKLLGMGDMLYYPMGARETIRVQGAFVSDAEIERILEFIKDNTEPTHYSEDLAEHIERCAIGENGVTPDTDDDGDALLPDAIALAVELGKISTSMIQRRLGVGYSRAGRIVDQMEARGIISGANGSKPRDVLISHADMTMAANGAENEE